MSGTSALPPFPPVARQWATLAVLVTAFLVSYVDRQLLALLVKPISATLGIRDVQMSLLIGFAFALFYAGFGVPLGRLADSASRKWLIVGGIALWSMATILCGFAGSFATLFLFRMLVGVGEAALAPASYSLLGDLFPPHRLVRATSILALAASLSTGLALIVGGQVIAFSGRDLAWPFGLDGLVAWQRSFILVGLPGFFVALLMLLIREPARRGRGHAKGAIAPAVFALLWARRRDYLPLYLTAAGMAVVTFGGLVWFPTHLIRTFAMTAATAGAALGAVQVAGSIVGTLIGVWSTERLLARGREDAHLRTVAVTAAMTATTMLALLMPTAPLTLACWFISVVLQSTYYGNLSAALQIVTPPEARGTNFAFFYLTINVMGLAIGTALIGAISEFFFPGQDRGIGYGLAIIAGIGASGASLAAATGLRTYANAVRRESALAEAIQHG